MPLDRVDIQQFVFQGALPYNNRLFFIQHLMPYVFMTPQCEGKQVLEIGSGDGFGSYYISRKAQYVVEVDNNLSSYNSLKKYIETYKKKNIYFIGADGIHLPFKARRFDSVVTCQVIEHIPEQSLLSFLQEICRVLKDRGTCLISTLNVENNIKNYLTYEKFFQHYKEFDRQSLEGILRKVFPKVEVRGLNVTLKHRFFRRFKKWGFLKYDVCGYNPVRDFYHNVAPNDFRVSQKSTKSSLDLVAICKKG